MAIKLFKRPLSPRLFLALPLILAACGVAEQQAERRVVRPVKTMVIGADETGGIRSFPARIESSRRADLSFRVPGKVVELLVREGERVEPGQVIAHLDPVTFQVVVDGRRATLDRITKDFERATDLLPRGVVPGQTYDRLEAEMKSATAALQRAPLDLDYTTFSAPFSGEIARRYIESFEEVQAKQTIIKLRDISALEDAPVRPTHQWRYA